MAANFDQIFVNLKHWLVALLPEVWQPVEFVRESATKGIIRLL